MAKNRNSKFGVADDLQYNEPEPTRQQYREEPAPAAGQTRKQGRPPKAENEKLRGYRYNLNLDRDLKEYLHETAWKNRTSITQYINDLIRTDMENDAEWKMKE